MEIPQLHSIQEISVQYATGDLPLSQLTKTDSILEADVFAHIVKAVSPRQVSKAVEQLRKDYLQCINRSKRQVGLLMQMPQEWAVPTIKIEAKMKELFSPSWIKSTFENFVECLKMNSNYGK